MDEAAAVFSGRLFIANPDLVERFREGVALAKLDLRTMYAGDASGYCDYPLQNFGLAADHHSKYLRVSCALISKASQ